LLRLGAVTGRAVVSPREKGRWLLFSLTVLVVDQWTKALIEIHLPLHTYQPVAPGLFGLTHVRNAGVAFGLFSGRNTSVTLSALGILALILVAVYFALARTRDRWRMTALSLVMGGAVGNLTDRLASGAVTDFLDFHVGSHHWPSFNVADSAITVGIVLLALDVFRSLDPKTGEKNSGEKKPAEKKPAEQPEP